MVKVCAFLTNELLNESTPVYVLFFLLKASNAPGCSLQHAKNHRHTGLTSVSQEMGIEYEREEMVVSPWALPEEIHKILLESHSSLLQVKVVPDF